MQLCLKVVSSLAGSYLIFRMSTCKYVDSGYLKSCSDYVIGRVFSIYNMVLSDLYRP